MENVLTWVNLLISSLADNVNLLISFTSLIIAFIALYRTVLKKGEPVVYPLLGVKDIDINRNNRYYDKPVTFDIKIPIIARNKRAQGTAIGEIKYTN